MNTRKHLPDEHWRRLYNTHLQSDDWYWLKQWALHSADDRCERCGRHRSRHQLELHHLHYAKDIGEETLEDVAVLCKPCHKDEDAARAARTGGVRLWWFCLSGVPASGVA